MTKGKFITIEGPDGAGKTTMTNALVKRLESEGKKVFYTREPGGTNCKSAEEIRKVIILNKVEGITEALLFAASRREHLLKVVLPKVQEGYIVLCDRFVDSSLAYQGFGRELGFKTVWNINKFAVEKNMPIRTLLLMVEPKKGIQRIMSNRKKGEINRLDAEEISFHEKVHDGYLYLAKKFKKRIKVINADQTPEAVVSDAYKALVGII